MYLGINLKTWIDICEIWKLYYMLNLL